MLIILLLFFLFLMLCVHILRIYLLLLDLLKSFDNDIKQQGISELSALLSERNFPSDQMEATIVFFYNLSSFILL